MLLNKKIKFLLLSLMIFAISLPIIFSQTESVTNTQTCSSFDIKEALRKALFEYFYFPRDAKLTVNEIKDLIQFYITSNTSQITIDCSGIGPFSGKPYYLMLGAALQITRDIPRCTDGTPYGRCSSRGIYYCYGGRLVEKCSICGCGANARCDTSTNKCIPNVQNITCNVNTECGSDGYVSLYYCYNGSVYRNYTMNTCNNPTTIYSSCQKSTNRIIIDKCGIGTYCKEGQSTCIKNVTDLAPSVAISIMPKIVAAGQTFNITVIGTDDVGLSMIWWLGITTTDLLLDVAHIYSCNGSTFCKNTWTVSTDKVGTLTFGANSRDTSYPIAGEPHQASEGAGIAYDTVTVTSTPVPSLDIVTVRGRWIDYFTQQPIANAIVLNGQNRKTVYTNANGEFAINSTSASNITTTNANGFGTWPKCYEAVGFAIFRKTDNSLYANVNIFDLIGPDKSYPITTPEVNFGDTPFWPAVDVAVNTDIPVQFWVQYNRTSGSFADSSGNLFYKTSHYLSASFPLNVNARIKLIDSAGKVYYSPTINLPLSHGCTPVKLDFFSNQFSWSVPQAIVSNATTNCFVKVNGTVIKSVYATDRIDCYNKTSFGSLNCQVYTSYFKDGVNFLEQYFGTTDRVNSDYCTCQNGVCITTTSNQTNYVTLYNILINGSNLEVTYSKNFDTCVHLVDNNFQKTSIYNFYCVQGSSIKIVQPISYFNVTIGKAYKLCHGNNYNICSELKTLISLTNQTCIDYDNGDNIFVASYAKKGTQAQYDKCGTAGQNYDIIEGVCTNDQLSGVPHSCPAGTKCKDIKYEPDVYANVSACVNETINQTTLPAPMSGNEAGAYFGANNEGFYSQGVRFYYNASSLSQVHSFRLYLKKPTDTSFNLTATFVNPASIASACSGSVSSAGWTLSYHCGAGFWYVDSTAQRASYFSIGEYQYYFTAVNSAGVESAPSPIFKEYVLQPTRILSPTTAQSPVATNFTIQWTVASGWSSGISPTYLIGIYDAQTRGENPIYLKPITVSPSLFQYSYVYDGPALDPTKRYKIISSAGYTTWTTSPRISYQSMIENLETFWVQSNQTINKSITILSPNGGETWYYNKSYPIQYKSSGVRLIGFQIYNGTQIIYYISPLDAGATFTYKVDPAREWQIGTGNNYKIKIYNFDNPAIFDESDAPFSIAWNITTTTSTVFSCTDGVTKTVDFENPPQLSFHLTWNPDSGTQSSTSYNEMETARQWLKSQGINMTGIPNGFVWGTALSGPVGKTGVVIGYASPDWSENDQGVSDNEVLTVNFVNASVKSAIVKLTSLPTNVASVNNIPTTVIMSAYNSAGSLVTDTTKTFTGVTNGVYTPTTLSLSSTSFNIAKVTLKTTQYPVGGVWLEDISFCT